MAEYHLMPGTREDRSLAAHQPRTQNANSHTALPRLSCQRLGCIAPSYALMFFVFLRQFFEISYFGFAVAVSRALAIRQAGNNS